jgi:ATP-dependent HslUV protease ATP-binding subunit HslU
LLDLLLPVPSDVKLQVPVPQAESPIPTPSTGGVFVVSPTGDIQQDRDADAARERYMRTRDKLRQLLRDGQLEQREVEIEIRSRRPMFEMMTPQGAPGHGELLGNAARHARAQRSGR